MKKSDITFDELRRFLLDLGFREVPQEKPRHKFEHPCGSMLLFRLYKNKEKVLARDIWAVGDQLVDQGVVEPSVYDRFQHKALA